MDEFVPKGSQLWIFCDVPEDEREDRFARCGFDPRRDLQRLKVMHEVGDPVSRKDLEMLPLVRFGCRGVPVCGLYRRRREILEGARSARGRACGKESACGSGRGCAGLCSSFSRNRFCPLATRLAYTPAPTCIPTMHPPPQETFDSALILSSGAEGETSMLVDSRRAQNWRTADS